MSFPEARARQQAAVFARLGEPGHWNSATDPVQVRLVEADDMASLGELQLIVPTMAIRVRKADRPDVQVDDTCWIVAIDRTFRVTSDPMLDRNGVWVCPVVEVT
ncbi:head-tail joining protein [Brevundimonas subvibrioides]|uniref:Uncharacterized protein n=1 Tax=Brevundimonas subvibrioides (strain ATCC 15264 / DSM 4735 / LMG 14903 / NBRC 16000 / CB 81) TaxID=633149 RepID=D9QI89_BRESC|nr:hypothetical protein [Brevundimonas subvibrioides]ADK99391.1 conserved hypothetical protein [Brevundimonas subvibrioides ATCC 15264]